MARRSELVTRDTLVAALDLGKKQSVVMLARAADELALPYVVVQSFALARAREFDDLTRDKTDQRDAGLIADLVCDLHFTEARLEHGPWAELRLLAEARQDRLVEQRAAMQEQRALLELTWPALLEQVPDLAGSHLQATLRLGLTPLEIAALPLAEFSACLQHAHRPRRFMRWMAGRIWEAAGAASASDELSAATVRWQQAAERIMAAEQAVAALDARMLSAVESTGLGWMRGQLRGLGDPDFQARFTALTTRAHRPLVKQQAYVAVANKLLRTLWAMATSGLPYSSARANGRRAEEVVAAA